MSASGTVQGREPRTGWLVAGVPAVAAVAVFGWARWCFAASPPLPTATAVVVGAFLAVGACAAYYVLVGGNGALFGVLFLALGLLMTVAAADQATARAEVATCVVGEVHSKVEGS